MAKARSSNNLGAKKPRKLGRKPPSIRGVTCQRCLLRLEMHPDHICVWGRGFTSCRYCLRVRHRCAEIPADIKPAAEAALQFTGEELKVKIHAVRQMIRRRTRRTKEQATCDAAAAAQLQESLEQSLNEAREPLRRPEDCCLSCPYSK